MKIASMKNDTPSIANARPKTFPNVAADSLFTVLYYDGMEAIIQGLQKTNGDLSNNEQAFQAALKGLQPTFPNGSVKLDQNNNSIQPAYVVQITKDGGQLGFKVVQTVDSVDQTFGGLFKPGDPAPSRTAPDPVQGTPPPWGK